MTPKQQQRKRVDFRVNEDFELLQPVSQWQVDDRAMQFAHKLIADFVADVNESQNPREVPVSVSAGAVQGGLGRARVGEKLVIRSGAGVAGLTKADTLVMRS